MSAQDSYFEVFKFLKDCGKSIKHAEMNTKVKIDYQGKENSYNTNITFSEDVNHKTGNSFYSIGIDDFKIYYTHETFRTDYQYAKYIKDEYLIISDKTTGIEVKIFM